MSRAYRLLAGTASLALTVAAAALLAPSASAAAATLHVDAANGNDTGNCVAAPCETIQYAVDQAADGDTVSIAAGTYANFQVLQKSLTIEGSGSTGTGATVIDAASSGDVTSSGIAVSTDPNAPEPESVTVKSLKVKGGGGNSTLFGIFSTVSDLDVEGVAVIGAQSGMVLLGAATTTVHVRDSTFSDDATAIGARGSGSPIELHVERSTMTGGGIQAQNVSSVTITGTTITGATTAGVYLQSLTGGPATATISDSTISGTKGVGVLVQGGADGHQTVTVDRSTIAGGTLGENGGTGIAALDDAAVHVSESTITNNGGPGLMILPDDTHTAPTATVSKSTVSGNTGNAILFAAQAGGPQTVTVTDSTLVQTKPWPADEGAPFPKGVIASGSEPGAPKPTAKVSGTIIAGGGGVPACAGVATTGGYNLATDDTCGLSVRTSLAKTDPQLGKLADNGGPTQTQLPAAHSPAVDAIPFGQAGCTSGAADQRGVSRPQPGPQGRCDVGAVELAQAPLVISPKTLPHGTVGKAYHVQLHATGGLDSDYTFALAKGSTLPADLTLSKDGLISGTPKTAGTFTFTVVVGDPVTRTYHLVVDPVAATTTPSSSGSGSPAGSGPILADTGAPVAPRLWWAAWLLGAGAVLLLAGSSRRRLVTRRH